MSFSFRQTIPTARATKDENIFAGRSSLRADEKKKEPGQAKNSALEAYLAKKYASGGPGQDGDAPVKRKKKTKMGTDGGGAIRIVDQDISGFQDISAERRSLQARRQGLAGDEDAEEESPTIANPEEAAALMAQVHKAKSGSGWVPLPEAEERSRPAGASGRPASPDASPPRRKQRHDSPDASPPRRKQRHDSPNASPPRRKQRHDGPVASPPRRKQRHDSPDASPPRRKQRHDSPDASPPRHKQRHDGPDASPPRRKQRHDGPDASPPRRKQRHDGPDASPPRRHARSPKAAAEGAARAPPPPSTRMGDGTAAGLVTAEQLAVDIKKQREQAEERRRNAEGRGAQTVYRDKATGRVMTAEEALRAKEDERAARKKPSIFDEDQTLEWRGGLAQKREAEERKRVLMEEAAKPFARSDIDNSHDMALRDRVRFGDPFANLARRKQASASAAVAAPITERYDAEKLDQSGFKIPQEVPPHSWLKRGVAAPANRYNILPGRQWDGVVRGNGFEKKMFEYKNLRAAKELEARLWSMGDM